MRKTAGATKRAPRKATHVDFLDTLVAMSTVPAVIDAHTHTFNASDLSVQGFVADVILDSAIGDVIGPLLGMIVEALAGAPDFKDEMAHLDALEHALDKHALREFSIASTEQRRTIDGEYWASITRSVRALPLSSNATDRELYRRLMEELPKDTPLGAPHTALLPETADFTAQLVFSPGSIWRLIQWAAKLKHYRTDIIQELVDTYGKASTDVGLFVSALVDFQFWVREAPHTSLDDQIPLCSRLMKVHAGRIHYFAPYDPFREVMEGGALARVQDAVNKKGFIGVKLYPPMGFAPIGNDKLTFNERGLKIPPDFGKKLDTALGELYQWALSEGVPLMAHCNNSNGSFETYALRAAPALWANALDVYPGLRINLGHFGGQKYLPAGSTDPGGTWPTDIINLMAEPKGRNVYTDVANFDFTDGKTRKKWLPGIIKALGDSKELSQRLMYGTDWIMSAKESYAKDYLTLAHTTFEKLIKVDPAKAQAFFGGNALTFLGLQAGEKNRARLEKFYTDNKLPLPNWLP